MSYQEKYLKYKKKYLELKAGAGGITDSELAEDLNKPDSCQFDNNNNLIPNTECPGRSILVNRPTVEFNKDTSIYLMLGHGCDLYQEKIVPANCKYITRSICGKSASADAKWWKLPYDFSINSSIINNPNERILKSNYDDESYNRQQHMKIHNTETNYINSVNECVMDISIPCGLYRIGENNLLYMMKMKINGETTRIKE
jgi:hypothetical protein